MSNLHFSDLQISDTLPPLEQEVTQDTIDLCAVAHLDYNPLHTDIEWCKSAQILHSRTVCHGMFTMSMMASVITRAWQNGGAVVRSMESKFTKPVPNGQTVRYEGTVVELHPRGPDESYVVVNLSATDGDGDTVAVAKAEVTVPD